MRKVVVDAATRAKLHNLETPLEFCDIEGQLLGYFHPVADARQSYSARSPFSVAELQRRRAQRSGLPVTEVLKRLQKVADERQGA